MSFIVHQALYGDKDGSYSLLDSSLDAATAKIICNVTDLLDRPSIGVLTEAIYRGFAFNDYYLFIKTFPDTDSGVRSGRVLSHVLVVNLTDLELCDDLSLLFSTFIKTANKSHKVKLINYVNDQRQLPEKIESGTRAALVVNEFVDNDYIAWTGVEGYLDALQSLWYGFPTSLRCRLKIGAAFDPRKLNEDSICFHYILEAYEEKWRGSACTVISKNSFGIIESTAASYLAGDRQNASNFYLTLDKFQICIESLEDLNYLVILFNAYSNLDNTEISNLVTLCDLISIYCSNKSMAKNEKINVIDALIKRIEFASPAELLILNNPNWTGFDGISKVLKEAISNRFMCFISQNSIQGPVFALILSALQSKASNPWWIDGIIEPLKAAFENWQHAYADSIWQWLQVDHNVLDRLEKLIPNSREVEESLVDTWFVSGEDLANELQVFSRDRNWYDLHALSILCLYSAEECILKQLDIDLDFCHINAIEVIANEIDCEAFLSIALEIEDPRLSKLAALKIKSKPVLLNGFKESNSNWINICLECCKLGLEIWNYIGIKVGFIYRMFDEVNSGLTLSFNIYSSLVNAGFNDLSEYPNRKMLWNKFNFDTKALFLNNTAIGCIILVDQEMIDISSLETLEPEIFNAINNDGFIEQIISANSFSTAIKIETLKRFKGLSDASCCFLIRECKFSDSDSIGLGVLIHSRKWKESAVLCKSLYAEQGRLDLLLALNKCVSLIKKPSALEKLKSKFNFGPDELIPLQDKKFQVALSFPGERREYVKAVAGHLLECLDTDEVFYDNNFKHLISQPNADGILQDVYRKNSELVVVFICSSYDEKQWCGLEWRAIRDMIKHKKDLRIMPVRFDDQNIGGLFSIDGHVDANAHTEKELADLILKRLAVLLQSIEKV